MIFPGLEISAAFFSPIGPNWICHKLYEKARLLSFSLAVIWFFEYFFYTFHEAGKEKGGQLCKYTLFCMNAKKNWPRNASCAYFQVKHHFPQLEMRGARRIFFRASTVSSMGRNWAVFPTHFAHISRASLAAALA